MRSIVSTMLLSMLFLVGIAYATRDGKYCPRPGFREIHEDARTTRSHRGDDDVAPRENDLETRETVESLDETLDGQHGGRLYLFQRKPGMPWMSNYEGAPNAIQGNPLWLINILGEEAAGFFGSKLLSNSMVTSGNATELANAISLVNDELIAMGEPIIPFSFIDEPKGLLTSREYADDLIDGFIPLATRGKAKAHDAGYHVPAIAMPPKYPQHAKIQAAYFKKLEAFIESKHPEVYSDPRFQAQLEKAYTTISKQYDNGTGNFVKAIDKIKFGNRAWTEQLQSESIETMTYGGATPRGFADAILLSSYRKFMTKEFKQSLDGFFARNPGPSLDMHGGMSIYSETMKRVAVIQEAVARAKSRRR